jgi:hypothetical protein
VVVVVVVVLVVAAPSRWAADTPQDDTRHQRPARARARLSRNCTALGQEDTRSSRLAGHLEQSCRRFGNLVQ